jgi:hypothetical protein
LRSFSTSTGNDIQPAEASSEQFIPQCSDDGKVFSEAPTVIRLASGFRDIPLNCVYIELIIFKSE